jgi:hypothetical protein
MTRIGQASGPSWPEPGQVDPAALVSAFPGLEADLQAVRDWMGTGDLRFRFSTEPMSAYADMARSLKETYPQFPADRRRTGRISRLLKDGAVPWPVFVDEADGFVMEGRHRIVAFLDAGFEAIPVVFVCGA